MLESLTATMATALPARVRASKTVSHDKTGRSYFVIPCSFGPPPVKSEAKQTGVLGGKIDASSISLALDRRARPCRPRIRERRGGTARGDARGSRDLWCWWKG